MTRPYDDEAPMRRVAPLLIVLLAALAVILAVVAALDRAWGPQGNQTRPAEVRRAVAPTLETAPQPQLQDYLAQKQRQARGYAWIDPDRHLARIPIEDAMRALAASSTEPADVRAAYLMGADAPSKEAPARDAAQASQRRKDKPSAGDKVKVKP
ncbi:MAG TPA: hypothetical protein VNQ97_03785 [Burkholderiaceae bacterium]|nr:hypothetical protein [Burkholderiaceae bacterium]